MRRFAIHALILVASIAIWGAEEGDAHLQFEPTPVPTTQVAPGVDEATRGSLAKSLDELNIAFQKADPKLIVERFNFERMVQEIERTCTLRFPVKTRSEVVETFGSNLAKYFARIGRSLYWHRIRILKVLPQSSADECVVLVRQFAEEGDSSRVRWWLKRAGASWQVYDFEDLSTNMRMSTAAATSLIRRAPNQGQDSDRLNNLLAATTAIAGGDIEKADELLTDIPDASLPPFLRSLKDLLMASLRTQQGRAEEALKLCDRGLAAQPDMAAFHFLRGCCLAALEEHDQAIAACRKYEELVGLEPSNRHIMALAFRGLGKDEQALKACREALDDEPVDIDLLYTLAVTLPDGLKVELTERFARSEHNAKHFGTLASRLQEAEETAALDALCEGQRRLKPDDPKILYYQAQACRLRKELGRALNLYQAFWSQLKTEEEREPYQADFWQLHVEAQRWREAYETAPDARAALKFFAPNFISADKYHALKQLLQLHSKRDPRDSQVHYYEGISLSRQRKYRKAESAFQQGRVLAADEEQREQFRTHTVYARFMDGRGLTAYEDRIEPLNETFSQLGRLYVNHEMPDQLEALLILRRRDTGSRETAETACLQSSVSWMRGDWATTAKELQEHRELILGAKATEWSFHARLTRCLIRLGRKEEALAVAQAEEDADVKSHLLLAVHVAMGDAEKARECFAECIEHGNDATTLYDDEDVGKTLRSPAYAELHKKYPPDGKQDEKEDGD